MIVRLTLLAVCILLTLCVIKSNSLEAKIIYADTGSMYYAELAKIHQKYGFYDEAIAMYKKALDVETDEGEKQRLRISISKAYIQDGNFEDAKSIISSAIESETDKEKKSEYYLMLAEICAKLGNSDKAIEAYTCVVKSACDDLYIHTARQKMLSLLKETGKFQEYVVSLEKHVAEKPDDTAALECLAYAYSSDEACKEKALPIFEKLFALKSDARSIANYLVQTYKRAGQYDKAVAVYQKAMESSPQVMKRFYYERISDLYADAHKEDEALKWDRKILEEDPDNPYSCLRVAERCRTLGKDDDAEEMYIAAISKFGKEDEKETASLKLVDHYMECEKYDDAEKLSSELLKTAKDEDFKKELEIRIAKISGHLNKEEN